ncbi:MAG TPA: ROK family transcriptional regulator [Pelagibacterium sp.]|uniref:ROK family transcriptional regulator n=1 Tax=Pelagibacterium sp. TaxID=1967288 RepID=UPI002B94F605|nr:ROK family transcriptional regulator [Pelagibacterium sp.]HWJ87454.1 ROK family transcriptional regulator [Pelagibacterium sp.]
MLTTTHYQILRHINAGGPTTRAELGAHVGSSKAAMSGFTRELLEKGLLRETSTVQKQGRPSALLDLKPEGAYFAGVSIMSDPALVALVDLKGKIVARIDVPRDTDPDVFADHVANAVPQLLETGKVPGKSLMGMGVALSGLVDQEQANCIKSTILGWQDVPLARLIGQRTGLPTFVENDAKSLALREKLFGEARDIGSFTLIWLGKGIGAAHFVHDRLYRGAHGGAGEIAHCTVDVNGLPCRCGKIGCLDTVASMIAILETARTQGIGAESLNDIETAAARGSSAAIRLLHRAGSALGLAIAQIIQINDPQMVLVTHQEQAFNGLFAAVMQQTIEANVLPRLSGDTPLRIRGVDNDAWALGAASVATHSFLNGSI